MELSAFFLQISTKISCICPQEATLSRPWVKQRRRSGVGINSMNHGELFHHLQGDDES